MGIRIFVCEHVFHSDCWRVYDERVRAVGDINSEHPQSCPKCHEVSGDRSRKFPYLTKRLVKI